MLFRSNVKKEITKEQETGAEGESEDVDVYRLDFTFREGDPKRLEVRVRYTKHELHPNGLDKDDLFEIKYGPIDGMELYELPNLGEMKGCYNDADNIKVFVPESECGRIQIQSGESPKPITISKDLKIHNVTMKITNEDDINEGISHVLNINIGLYHPTLGNRYAISIVAPINYQ